MSSITGSVRLATALALAFVLASCAAARVATHDVSLDPVDVPAGVYHMDAEHWSVLFDVSHFGYSRFVMRFDRAKATLDIHPGDIDKGKLKREHRSGQRRYECPRARPHGERPAEGEAVSGHKFRFYPDDPNRQDVGNGDGKSHHRG